MKPSTLYLSYTGLSEPLGRSQVLAYLSRLSRDYSITLVTFEKRNDFENQEEIEKLKLECVNFGIDWQPRIYHHKPRLLATVWDLFTLFWDTFRLSLRNKVKLIHCRSYIPAIAAWAVGKITRTPFIFDMRALWPEEMIDARRLSRKSVIYKVLKYLERKLLVNSAVNISLTNVAVPYLVNAIPNLSKDKFSVIPTCVDLTRFDPSLNADSPLSNTKLGTMGTVISGWYHLDWLFNTLKFSAELFPESDFKVVTRDDSHTLDQLANSYNLSNFSVEQCSADEVKTAIDELKFGILYFTAGVSKIGSAPTRMAEFLACGKPILGNRGVGDMADLIEKYNVGVVIEDGSDEEIKRGLKLMHDFLLAPDYPERCRKAAVELFSADVGAEKYHQVYERCIK
ncbi:glycosyltransferase [Vibrio sp. 10N.286.51.B11]|uniref:glycosyltransferase n=1 Tax=Vibrio sp. 10N.286.51.B11 TaxID=3229706 RepID=UPI00354FDFAD